MISGLDKVINLDDPVGQTEQPHTSPSGFEVSKMRVPLGVIGIIYESRPNRYSGRICIVLEVW